MCGKLEEFKEKYNSASVRDILTRLTGRETTQPENHDARDILTPN